MKWFIIGTLLYYTILLWRYRDSLGTWFRSGKKEPEQPDNPQLPKTKNTDCIVGTSRYRMGQMRTNGDISGQLSKTVDNASIFAPQSDEAVTETPDNKQPEDENSSIQQPIETEFEMQYEAEETEETDISAEEIEAEEIACYMGENEPEMAQGITLAELGQMVQVIQIEQSTEAEEQQAVQTICRTETNLLHTMVEQINGGISRVAELLQKHEIPAPVPDAGSNEVVAFDVNDIL